MYYFYMGSVLLPVTPEKFTLSVNNANKTITLINEGEVNVLKEAGLTDLEFDALIPAVQYPFAKYEDGFKPINYFTDHFEDLKTSKKPFQFVITRRMPNKKVLFNTNMTVSLESYTIKEDAKQGFDLVVSFKLKQYKSFGTKIIKVSNKKATSTTTNRDTTSSPAPENETTYTVKKGDCLWNIAKKFYGDGSKYTEIYNANKDKIKNPNLIYVGQVLVIPNADSVQTKTNSNKSSKSKSNEPTQQSTQKTEKIWYTVTVTCANPSLVKWGYLTLKVYGKNGLVKEEKFYPISGSPSLRQTVEFGHRVIVSFYPYFNQQVEIVNSTSNWAGLSTYNRYVEAIDKDSTINFKWVSR